MCVFYLSRVDSLEQQLQKSEEESQELRDEIQGQAATLEEARERERGGGKELTNPLFPCRRDSRSLLSSSTLLPSI